MIKVFKLSFKDFIFLIRNGLRESLVFIVKM